MQNKKKPILADIPPDEELVTFTLEPAKEQISRLCTLMHNGCYVKVECGKTMRDLLCEQFQIPFEYVRKDIKVIFLEFSPVDNIETAIIKDGATLALSAAMPGLVGAAMRRDGDLTWLRSSITYQEGESDHQVGQGLIQIKLFNRVMADLGESFLRRGVYVRSKYLSEFLTRFTPEFWKEFGTISKNQDAITNEELSDFVTHHNQWVKVIIT
ncbi:MAG: hypothetical protein EG828_00185 [Deltaproteobacteria bacterium]|nr:hypothetical protein [Deltaproteobacteria bacterium]